ncbi:patatin-like phospholipase family protein [Christensenella tenuis]|uniref:Patatin family protein n=1 Tax=Christensenella tenuis TaxID=2763033 RepID=A0ABR7EI88_9FIRM|nr:patatin family protein [Christensenella tenuis]MBC5649490.1 patatin family protein [Christensenella tenuis]
MIGLIDGGGGMRGVYTAGIYDRMLDEHTKIDYGIGVSAGAANMITYLAGQRGRTLTFFADYTFRREYMSVANWLKDRNYLNLDYIYTTLTNRGGENPLDYEAFSRTSCPFFIVATDAQTGRAHYFTRSDIAQDSYDVLKASCAIPAACKPYPVNGRLYYDGGVAEPIPYQKAFDDGCDKIIVLITRHKDYVKPKQKNMRLLGWMLKKYPEIVQKLAHRHEAYNRSIKELKELAQQGRALLVAPSDGCGVDTFTKDRKAFLRLYEKGYKDGGEVAAFIQKNN